MIYDANVNSFTVSRHDFANLGGAYAASSFDQYIVGNNVLDASGVSVGTLNTTSGNPSGFAFVDQGGYFTTAPNSFSPGVIAQVDLGTRRVIQPTQMVEAPILGSGTPSTATTTSVSCTSSTVGGSVVQTCTTTITTGSTLRTQTCVTTSSSTATGSSGTVSWTPSAPTTLTLPPLWHPSITPPPTP